MIREQYREVPQNIKCYKTGQCTHNLSKIGKIFTVYKSYESIKKMLFPNFYFESFCTNYENNCP